MSNVDHMCPHQYFLELVKGHGGTVTCSLSLSLQEFPNKILLADKYTVCRDGVRKWYVASPFLPTSVIPRGPSYSYVVHTTTV